MAVRLRWTGRGWVALCVAEYEAQPGDVYIDDAQDHALRQKYLADYESEGLLNTSGQSICEARRKNKNSGGKE